jgi:hypothetical protein
MKWRFVWIGLVGGLVLADVVLSRGCTASSRAALQKEIDAQIQPGLGEKMAQSRLMDSGFWCQSFNDPERLDCHRDRYGGVLSGCSQTVTVGLALLSKRVTPAVAEQPKCAGF